MKLIWMPYLILITIVGIGLLAFENILNSRPMDDSIVYQVLQRHLHQPQMVGNHLLNLSPAKMIQKNGEAVVVGKGSAQYSGAGATVPVLENINFEYIMIISRQCHNLDAKCYTAQEVELTGEKSSFPLI